MCPTCNEKVENTSDNARPSHEYPVGFLLCSHGVNKGTAYIIKNDINKIGSNPNMDIYVRGDKNIEAENHAILLYDNNSTTLYLKGVSSLGMVYVDDEAVYDTIEVQPYQTIHIGDTYLTLIAFCGHDFSWIDLPK